MRQKSGLTWPQMIKIYAQEIMDHIPSAVSEFAKLQHRHLQFADMDKCPQDKCCLDKCHGDSCKLLYTFPAPYV